MSSENRGEAVDSIYAGEEDERVVMRLLSRLIREANYKGEEEEEEERKKEKEKKE